MFLMLKCWIGNKFGFEKTFLALHYFLYLIFSSELVPCSTVNFCSSFIYVTLGRCMGRYIGAVSGWLGGWLGKC